QRWALVQSFTLSWVAVGCCYAGLAAAWNWRKPRARNRLLALLLVGLNLAVWQVALETERPGVVFLDPGSGDALVLEDGLGRRALVDAGINGTGALRDYLGARGIRRMDLAVITHPDLDHYGGLLDLPGHFRIGTLLVATLRGDTAYRGVIGRFQGRGTRVLVGGAGTSVRLGGWTLDFIWPSAVARARFARGMISTNDLSLVALARHGGRALLLTGDLDEPRILADRSATAWLLKSPHHGSRQGNPDLLFDVVRPEVVVVMGRYPTPAGLEERLACGGLTYVNTRRDGAWQLVFQGERVREIPYRPARF
ncbi:MBL fold metallo-hydrolase, partial [candidate division WOR-3 bacterium]|nr:MBL fold metallo-hydrolase [candidate division WOR-3 bacterium]